MTSSVVRSKISSLIEQWQKICILAERIIKRREAAAVRVSPPPLPGRNFMQAHFALPPFSPAISASSTADGETQSLTSSILSGLHLPRNTGITGATQQSDTARLTNTLRALVEVNERCWRGDECELCSGVRQGLGIVAQHTQIHADAMEERVRRCFFFQSLREQLRFNTAFHSHPLHRPEGFFTAHLNPSRFASFPHSCTVPLPTDLPISLLRASEICTSP